MVLTEEEEAQQRLEAKRAKKRLAKKKRKMRKQQEAAFGTAPAVSCIHGASSRHASVRKPVFHPRRLGSVLLCKERHGRMMFPTNLHDGHEKTGLCVKATVLTQVRSPCSVRLCFDLWCTKDQK